MATELHELLQTRTLAGTNGTAVTIANGASLSGSIDMSKLAPVAILMDGWSTAAMTFQASVDGSAFADLYDKDGEVTIASFTAAGSRYLVLSPSTFGGGFKYLKIRSGTSSAAVNQGALRTLIVIARPF